MIGIFLLTSVYSFLFSPQVITLYFYYDTENKRLFYSAKFFGIFKFNSGIITFDKTYAIFHYSKKKALAVKTTSIFPQVKQVKKMTPFECLEFKVATELGVKNDADKFYIASALNLTGAVISPVVLTIKPFIRLSNIVKLNTVETRDRFAVRTTLAFNWYIILGILIKSLWGKLIYGEGKKN